MLSKRIHGHPLVYLDSAATAQKPQMVIDAITDYYTSYCGTVHRAVYSLATHATEEYNRVRSLVAEFLNASRAEEIIFTRGCTESINLVSYCFGKSFLMPGDEIILSGLEHHSNIVPWQIACEDRGATLKIVPVKDSGELDLQIYGELLTSKTKIVALSHVSNAIGTINPIKKITQMAHQFGAKVLIDGAQAAPHMPIDVQELDVDFYVFSGHKLYGPTGIGILYGKFALLEQLSPYQGGGDMIKTVTFLKTTYNTPPLKFEAGTPMIAEVLGLGAAIRYLQSLSIQAIYQHEQQLFAYALSKLQAIDGVNILGTAKQRGAILTFTLKQIHPLDVATLLDLRGICIRTGHHCAQPAMKRFKVQSAMRVSFGLYNTFEEIDYFIDHLLQTISLL